MPGPRIAVIGGVAAGPAAAAEARRTDPDADVVLYEQGPHISYGACEMPYLVSGDIDDWRRLLVLTPAEFERTRHVKVRVHHRITALAPRRNRITVENVATGERREERVDKIILATGARARMPGLDGEHAPNVFPVRRLDDVVALDAYLNNHPGGHAVILGGGYVGVEMAEALRARGLRVTILQPEGLVLHAYLDGDLCALVQEEVRRNGVIVRAERATAFDRGADGRVRVVRTDRGERIGCDVVIVAMGIIPNVELAVAAGLRTGKTGALAVDDQMRTGQANVWACGDVIEVRRVIDDAQVHLALSPVAFRTAHVAGRNAARRGRGAPARFPGVSGASAVKVFGLEAAVVGLREDEARAGGFDAFSVTGHHWSRARLTPGARPLHVRLVVDRPTGRLLGGALVGAEGAALRADVLVPLLRDGATAADLRDLDLIYAPPFAPSIDPLLRVAHAAVQQLSRPARRA